MHEDPHEIRLFGRGGQGVVTAGDLLGKAAIHEGRWAQSIPTFGPERRGALAQATVRIGDAEILLKCTTAQPEALLVLDPTIWRFAPVTAGLRDDAVLIFNTTDDPADLRVALGDLDQEIVTLDATSIALEVIGRAITNTAMLGALVGATGLLEMASVEATFAERFGDRAAVNIEAAHRAAEQLERLARREK